MNKRFFLILKVIAAVLILTYLSFRINPKELWLAAGKGDLLLINIALFLLPLNIYLQFKKWSIVCSGLLEVNDNRKVFVSLLNGFTTGIVTPARVGEYVGRAIGIKGPSIGEISLAALIDKLFTLLIILLVGASALIIYLYAFLNVSLTLSISIFSFILILTFFVFKVLYSYKHFIKKIKNKYIYKVVEALYILKKVDSKFVLKMVGFSFIFYCTYIIQFSLLLDAFSDKINFTQCVWNSNLIMFFKSLVPSFTFGELGIREGITVYFLSQMHESKAAGFNASILIFFINLIIPSSLSFLYLFRRNDE